MKTKLTVLQRYGISAFTASFMLSACGGSQLPLSASGAMRQVSALQAPHALGRHRDNAISWMLAKAQLIKELVYVSDAHAGVVHVYNYTSGAPVGKLTGFQNPAGQCVDAEGNVFITDLAATKVYEYAHGGKSPIQALSTGGSPVACSVAPNGDLAVANHVSGGDDIAVFKLATGKPKFYSNPSCSDLAGAGYDGKSNLYIQLVYSSVICELPRGGRAIRVVKSNVVTQSPFGVMWDGKNITLADDFYGSVSLTLIFQMKEDASGNLTKVGQTTLTDANCSNKAEVYQPFIVGAQNTPINKQLSTAVIGENGWCLGKDYLWKYPKGGSPIRSFALKSSGLKGQSVSIAE